VKFTGICLKVRDARNQNSFDYKKQRRGLIVKILENKGQLSLENGSSCANLFLHGENLRSTVKGHTKISNRREGKEFGCFDGILLRCGKLNRGSQGQNTTQPERRIK
jgi:hypothetical protein